MCEFLEIIIQSFREKGTSRSCKLIIYTLLVCSSGVNPVGNVSLEVFMVSDGIRQDIILSPHLYNDYTNI